MDILATLNRKSLERGLQFMVVGGLAVSAHGYERQTGDIDLLVKRDHRDAWAAIFAGLGYKIFHEQDTFMQFSSPQDTGWPVDLMFVNEQTFLKMFAGSVEQTMKGAVVRIPSVEHLIALKIHALKYTNPRRQLKDLLDVASLIELNNIDINGKEFSVLCERYGNEKIRAQIIAALSK
jgi:hypothetical protein